MKMRTLCGGMLVTLLVLTAGNSTANTSPFSDMGEDKEVVSVSAENGTGVTQLTPNAGSVDTEGSLRDYLNGGNCNAGVVDVATSPFGKLQCYGRCGQVATNCERLCNAIRDATRQEWCSSGCFDREVECIDRCF